MVARRMTTTASIRTSSILVLLPKAASTNLLCVPTHRTVSLRSWENGDIPVERPGASPYAMKYFAAGCEQMMASVVCSGSSCAFSLIATPMRSAPKSSTTFALSARSGQAG